MSDYREVRCTSWTDFHERMSEYQLAVAHCNQLRQQGVVASVHMDVPLPPDASHDVISAKVIFID